MVSRTPPLARNGRRKLGGRATRTPDDHSPTLDSAVIYT